MTKQDTQKIHEALSLLNEAAHDKKDEINELLGSKYSALKEAVQGLESDVADKAHHGAERLGELKEAATERVKSTAESVDRKAHEEPWKVLGLPIIGALAIGYLLGRKD